MKGKEAQFCKKQFQFYSIKKFRKLLNFMYKKRPNTETVSIPKKYLASPMDLLRRLSNKSHVCYDTTTKDEATLVQKS